MQVSEQRLYRYRIPRHWKRQIQNHQDEYARILRLQYEPLDAENHVYEGFGFDPLSETNPAIYPLDGVIHKYPNKVLLLTNDECPVFCRYCTRKRRTLLPSDEKSFSLEQVVAYLENKLGVNEIIFSGGDPLMQGNDILRKNFFSLAKLETISFIRYHTKTFTALPKRFNDGFFDFLDEAQNSFPEKKIAFVFHVNHFLELNDDTQKITREFQRRNITLLNQAVLLKGVNDDSQVLAKLALRLDELGISFYYLHQLDKIIGSAHFQVEEQSGIDIMKGLRKLIPPYMMPRYVKDSMDGKINLFY